jgi:short-subunit dehydrogenase
MKKKFVISGASTGIGYSLATKLLSEGHTVIGVSRTINKSDLVRYQNFIPLAADLTKMEQITKIDSFIGELLKNEKEVFALINCIGDGMNKKFLELTEKDYFSCLSLNLFPSIFLTQSLLKYIRQPYGTVCNISSIAGIKPFANWSMYCASKYALEGFMASIREELRKEKIRVINIRPGSVDTPSYSHLSSEAKVDFINPTSVAKLISDILFLEDNATVEDVFINNTVGDL